MFHRQKIHQGVHIRPKDVLKAGRPVCWHELVDVQELTIFFGKSRQAIAGILKIFLIPAVTHEALHRLHRSTPSSDENVVVGFPPFGVRTTAFSPIAAARAHRTSNPVVASGSTPNPSYGCF